MAAGYGLFLREYLRRFHDTGSIAPSSRWLAASLCRYITPREFADRPLNILEVGPGTGAVTQHLVRQVGPRDRITLVELNDRFVEHLRGRLATEPAFTAVASRTRILHQRLEELPSEESFDVIISGLPLNNFSAEDVEQILARFRELLAPGGTLSFFEYIAIRAARALVSFGGERRRLRGINDALAALLGPYEVQCDWIWSNLPPAWVHHVQLSPAKA
jgi:phospholipid N-methyltransferase